MTSNIENLNIEFELVKKHLEIYLTKITQNSSDIGINEEFINLFQEGNPESILFLSFNYTPTIERYINLLNVKKSKVVYIHGELNSIKNPIIFGYGNDTEYQPLLKKRRFFSFEFKKTAI